jgi:hypothetical protein
VKILQHGIGSLRGAIGTPAQIAALLRRYEAAGVDQVTFVMQSGNNRHQSICESLELFGKEVLPRFAEEAPARERAKAERLAPAIAAALARRKPARTLPAYRIDEAAEIARSRPGAGRKLTVGERLAERGRAFVAGLAKGKTDAQLDRRFGSGLMQRFVFGGMARGFDPRMALGFKGDIVYELVRASGEMQRWTLRVDGDRASARRGDARSPAVRIRMPVPDFARVIGGQSSPLAPLWEGRVTVEGNLDVVTRLSEMFGGPSPF